MTDDRSGEGRVEAALDTTETDPTGWLETLYREDAEIVLQTAYRVTGSAADAEDVLQQFSALGEKAFLIGEIEARPTGSVSFPTTRTTTPRSRSIICGNWEAGRWQPRPPFVPVTV